MKQVMHTDLLTMLEIFGIRLKITSPISLNVLYSLACFFLLVSLLTFPLVLEIFRYFFPLVLSTGICLWVGYQDFWFKKQAGRERSIVKIGKDEQMVEVQEYDREKFCIHINDVEVGYLALENPANLFAGDGFDEAEVEDPLLEYSCFSLISPEMEKGVGDCADMEKYLEADRIAERLWNFYFGKYSRWNYRSPWFKMGD
ncbi:hypothetical protein QJS10_CPB17g00812 [Acorus calamus]|uniref:Uncharacterized protein n=1 Tax=Acorus calamus TaxID=4465 RepID=A0AAV9CU17_ACOCL|nr:hypothetical protein QJS10_CPB17g00812 [Acorus calamus]